MFVISFFTNLLYRMFNPSIHLPHVFPEYVFFTILFSFLYLRFGQFLELEEFFVASSNLYFSPTSAAQCLKNNDGMSAILTFSVLGSSVTGDELLFLIKELLF